MKSLQKDDVVKWLKRHRPLCHGGHIAIVKKHFMERHLEHGHGRRVQLQIEVGNKELTMDPKNMIQHPHVVVTEVQGEESKM